MPASTYWGMQHLNNNVMCAVHVDMTGPDPTRHELFEVCVLPLSNMLDIHPELLLFNMRMKPRYPDEIDFDKTRATKKSVSQTILYGYDRDKVAELLYGWFVGMNMYNNRKLIPLGYNYAPTQQILIDWLGFDLYDEIFLREYRDLMVAARFWNDRDDVRMHEITFKEQTLRGIGKVLSVPLVQYGGSAQADCLTIAQAYKGLVKR